jgi:hypothetical protein
MATVLPGASGPCRSSPRRPCPGREDLVAGMKDGARPEVHDHEDVACLKRVPHSSRPWPTSSSPSAGGSSSRRIVYRAGPEASSRGHRRVALSRKAAAGSGAGSTATGPTSGPGWGDHGQAPGEGVAVARVKQVDVGQGATPFHRSAVQGSRRDDDLVPGRRADECHSACVRGASGSPGAAASQLQSQAAPPAQPPQPAMSSTLPSTALWLAAHRGLAGAVVRLALAAHQIDLGANLSGERVRSLICLTASLNLPCGGLVALAEEACLAQVGLDNPGLFDRPRAARAPSR